MTAKKRKHWCLAADVEELVTQRAVHLSRVRSRRVTPGHIIEELVRKHLQDPAVVIEEERRMLAIRMTDLTRKLEGIKKDRADRLELEKTRSAIREVAAADIEEQKRRINNGIKGIYD